MCLYSIILFMIFIHYSSMITSLATSATRKCLVRDACKYTSIHIHMRSHVLAIKHAPLFAAQRAAEETKVRCGRCCFVVKKKIKKRKKGRKNEKKQDGSEETQRSLVDVSRSLDAHTALVLCNLPTPPPIVAPPLFTHISIYIPFSTSFQC